MTRFACLAALLVASAAAAQSYPNRAVKVIVPWTPGQATDIAARVVAQKLQEALGQAFVIDNKPGAGGAIGTDAVAKSPPDGYTLLAASSGPLSIMPNLQKTPYEPLNDLAPISLVAATPFALVTHPAFPASNAKEFIALVKANPGKYTFSSSGTGATAHLFTELFNSMAQIQARHVPYKGSAPARCPMCRRLPRPRNCRATTPPPGSATPRRRERRATSWCVCPPRSRRPCSPAT